MNGWTNGCFDLLHPGHLDFLERARALCTHLTVFLNSDDSVRELKGPQRPILPAEYRQAALLATRWVDRVVIFDEEDPVYQWRNFERKTPDMYIKELGINITTSPEAVYLAQYNVPIVLINRTLDMSTTQLIELVRRAA